MIIEVPESMTFEVPDLRDRAGRILDEYAATRPIGLPWELVVEP